MADFDSSLPVRTVSTEELQVQTKVGTKLNVKTATDGDVVAKIVDAGGTNQASVSAAGAVKVDGSASTQPVSGTVTVVQPTGTNLHAVLDATSTTTVTQATGTNLHTVVDSVTGTVAENLTQVAGTAVDVNAGNASAGTLRVIIASNQPAINVNTSPTDKTNAYDYNTASAIASNATSTHTYTPGSTVFVSQISASASGKLKIEIQYGTTGAETTKRVMFTAPGGGLNATWILTEPLQVTSAQSIKIIRTNMDNQAQDVYSTVEAWS